MEIVVFVDSKSRRFHLNCEKKQSGFLSGFRIENSDWKWHVKGWKMKPVQESLVTIIILCIKSVRQIDFMNPVNMYLYILFGQVLPFKKFSYLFQDKYEEPRFKCFFHVFFKNQKDESTNARKSMKASRKVWHWSKEKSDQVRNQVILMPWSSTHFDVLSQISKCLEYWNLKNQDWKDF